MGIFDLLKRKIVTSKYMLFDSIEEMEACKECPLQFSYEGYPEIKQKYYKMPVSELTAASDGNIYACINSLRLINVKNIEDLLEKECVQLATNGTPIFLRITEDSFMSDLPYYVFYGFSDGVD